MLFILEITEVDISYIDLLLLRMRLEVLPAAKVQIACT